MFSIYCFYIPFNPFIKVLNYTIIMDLGPWLAEKLYTVSKDKARS